jgi:hypothetical protein
MSLNIFIHSKSINQVENIMKIKIKLTKFILHYAWLREEIVKREIGEREYEKRERCKKYVKNRVNLKYCLV